MKELLKQAFQAGRDFGHAMGTGRPTYGLKFDEWYSENENQALSLHNVVGQSEQLLDFLEWKQQVAVDDLTDKEIVEFYLARKVK